MATSRPSSDLADLGLEIPTIRPARRYDSPSSSTAPTASSRTSSDSGRVPPRPGGRGGSRWARQACETLPMVWSLPSPRTGHHGHPQ
jgi:hypothetical protein